MTKRAGLVLTITLASTGCDEGDPPAECKPMWTEYVFSATAECSDMGFTPGTGAIQCVEGSDVTVTMMVGSDEAWAGYRYNYLNTDPALVTQEWHRLDTTWIGGDDSCLSVNLVRELGGFGLADYSVSVTPSPDSMQLNAIWQTTILTLERCGRYNQTSGCSLY